VNNRRVDKRSASTGSMGSGGCAALIHPTCCMFELFLKRS
jgi:hypothetical protein